MSNVINNLSTLSEELEIGYRSTKPIFDDCIIRTRFDWRFEKYTKYDDCFTVFYQNKELGVVSKVNLSVLWDKASLKRVHNESLKLTSTEYAQVIKDVFKKLSINIKKPTLTDFLKINELSLQEAFVPNSSDVINIIRRGIEEDIAESKYCLKNWKKIKYYRHKLPLDISNGGIFDDEQTALLKKRGIQYLNEIKKLNIFELKKLFTNYDFYNIINDINAAYKEHRECRKDRSYQTVPYFFQAVTIIPAIIMIFSKEYNLIYDLLMTGIITLLVAIWGIAFAFAVKGAIRAKKRKIKRPHYRYFTTNVARAFVLMFAVAVVSITGFAVYRERYDGFENGFYFRELENNNVEVAGLRDKSIDVWTGYISSDKNVTKIGRRAFAKSRLKTVTLDLANITEIGEDAFKNCKNLRSVTLPKNITEIPNGIFDGCIYLEEVLNMDSLTSIGDRAFRECESLTNLNLPQTLETIGKQAFKSCSSLKELKLGSNIKSIGKEAFKDCVECEKISANNYIDKLEDKLFYGCESLTYTNLAERAIVIGKEVFAKCSSLKSIAISNDLVKMGKGVFNDCDVIEELIIPYIGKSKSNQTNWEYLFNKKTTVQNLTITGDTKLKKQAFKDFDKLINVTLTNINQVSEGLFESANGLVKVTLPYGMTEIGDSVFNNCTRLTEVVGFNNLQYVGNSAFASCHYLNVTTLSNIIEYGDWAFSNCFNIISIDLTNTTKIGKSVFFGCENLSTVSLANSALKEIPEKAFQFCESLESVDSFNNITKIGERAFNGTKLQSLNITGELKEIGKEAFYRCTELIEIVLPNSVSKIGKSAFKECTSLETVVAPYIGRTRDSFLAGFDYVFDSTVVASITLTDTKEIRDCTLSGAENLVSLFISANTQKISEQAFKDSPYLTRVFVPSGLVNKFPILAQYEVIEY